MDGTRTVAAVLVLVIVAAVWFVQPPAPDGPEPEVTTSTVTGDDRNLVALGADDDGPHLWPYVATRRSFDRRASSINMVVEGDADLVRWLLTRYGDVNWSDTTYNNSTSPALVTEGDRLGAFGWRDADATPRYVYVAPNGAPESGEWRAPDYQLHTGSYFGTQHHLRVYEVSDDDRSWTVIQAHAEHWDWFTLTHTVDSLEEPRRLLEREFIGHPSLNVRREYYGNPDTYDADGWTTVVTLAALGAVVPGRAWSAVDRAVGEKGVDSRHVLLFAAVLVSILGVRVAAVLLQQHADFLDVRTIGRGLYVAFIVGVPAGAYVAGRLLSRTHGLVVGTLAFATGVLLDYALLSIATLPLAIIVHRGIAALAVGLIAGGASTDLGADGREARTSRALLAAGVCLWTAVVAAAHLL